jgi:Porin subfamily
VPDIIANVRVDQPWGAAQIMGGVHDERARYYNGAGGPAIAGVAYPADAWGWAVGAGFRLNLPTKGDTWDVQTQYCRGWSSRCFYNSTNWRADIAYGLVNSGTIGLAWLDDAFMANSAATGATGLQLPTLWNVYSGIQHFWIPSLRTSLYGGYVNYRTGSSAVDILVCAPNGFANGCADWAVWQVGTRTLWNPTKNLDVGFDVQYNVLSKSAFSGGVVTFSPTGAAPHTFTVGSTNVVSAIFRVQRNFLP